MQFCPKTSAQVTRNYNFQRKMVSAKVRRLLVNRDFGLKMMFWMQICPKTSAQVTRNYNFQRKMVSAKVRRLLVNRDFELKMMFLDAILSPNQCTGYSQLQFSVQIGVSKGVYSRIAILD